MKQTGKKPLAIAVLAAFLLSSVFAFPVAAQNGNGEGAGFFVRAQLPENQADNGKSYFDLRMKPGQTQDLVVEVVNETGEQQEIEVRAVTASTNRNGVIDYTTADVRDETMLHVFSELAAPQKPLLTVRPNSSAQAVVRVTMPEEQYDGAVLGGLVFTKRPQPDEETGRERDATLVRNRFSYVVGVVLRETDTPVTPDFEVFDARAEIINRSAAPVLYIRNKNAEIAKNMRLVTEISHGDEHVGTVEREGLDMAPNSVMAFPAHLGADALAPGRYTAHTELFWDGKMWSFDNSFTVSRSFVRELNDAGIATAPQDDLPLWAVLLIGALALAVVVLGGYVLLRQRAELRRPDKARVETEARTTDKNSG